MTTPAEIYDCWVLPVQVQLWVLPITPASPWRHSGDVPVTKWRHYAVDCC